MTSQKTLAFIESSDIGVKYCGEAARLLGYEPLFICNLSHYQADPLRQLKQYQVIDCDTRDKASVLAALQKVPNLAGVTSFADTSLVLACEVAKELGVAGLDPAILKLKSKIFVSQLVPEFSPPSSAFFLNSIPYESLRELFKLTGKMIVKPTNSAGALGVVFLESEEDLARLPILIEEQKLPWGLLTGEWIAQARVFGDLVSVEGFVRQGQMKVLGFSRRKKIGSTESASAFPVDASLEPEMRTHSLAGIEALVERSGFKNGYFHIEYISGPGGSYLIDANVGRVGGGAVAEQLAASYGHSTIEVFQHILQVTMQASDAELVQLYQRPAQELQDTYAIFYGVEEGGLLQNIILPTDPQIQHTQILDQGAMVSPMGKNDWSWIGIISGTTDEALLAASQMRIETSSGTFQPYF